eukprot:6280377-Amphidinium_carterae.1
MEQARARKTPSSHMVSTYRGRIELHHAARFLLLKYSHLLKAWGVNALNVRRSPLRLPVAFPEFFESSEGRLELSSLLAFGCPFAPARAARWGAKKWAVVVPNFG